MRTRPLITALALAGACLLIGIPAGASSHGALTAGGSRPLEPPLTVPPTGKVVSSRTTLVRGDSYRLVLTGTVTTTNDFGTSDRLDPLYCFETFGTPPMGDPTTGSCTANTRRQADLMVGIGKPVGGLIEHQLNPRLLNKIPYQRNHRYEIPFRAKRAGKLAFEFFTILAQKTGSYQIALYGQPPRKKKAARPQACRARASASPIATAAACSHWFVNFTVSQEGFPAKSNPAPAASFEGTKTDAEGRVFFKRKPKKGRWAAGSAAGLLVHTDTYQSPINPFASEEGELIIKASGASYLQRLPDLNLTIRGEVTSASGVVYSKDASGHSIRKGDKATLYLLSDPPSHSLDQLALLTQCGNCPDAEHNHRYGVTPQDRLRVGVGTPQPCDPRSCPGSR